MRAGKNKDLLKGVQMRKSNARYVLTALICLAGLLLGCSTAVPPSYYRLDYQVEAGPQDRPPLPYVLALPPVNAPETLARSNILYRISPRILRHYQSRFWEQSPEDITHQQLVRTLRGGQHLQQNHHPQAGPGGRLQPGPDPDRL